MIHLTLRELLLVADRAIDGDIVVRDHGLLESALHRSRATVFGDEAYPTIDLKAAVLLHSLARNHALLDGDQRLALAGVIAFHGMNGRRLAHQRRGIRPGHARGQERTGRGRRHRGSAPHGSPSMTCRRPRRHARPGVAA